MLENFKNDIESKIEENVQINKDIYELLLEEIKENEDVEESEYAEEIEEIEEIEYVEEIEDIEEINELEILEYQTIEEQNNEIIQLLQENNNLQVENSLVIILALSISLSFHYFINQLSKW